jgi:hypothetical protein
MSKPLLIIIGADKGGVGKTTVSRTVLDYFDASGFSYRAFDTESPNGVLKRFFPRNTDVIDLATVPDQMKVFDTLSTEQISVIDVRAGLLSPTLKTLADVGLLDAVKTGQVNLIVMHVLGASVASLSEVKETSAIIEGAKYFLVKNHINGSTFFEWDAAAHDAVFKDVGDGIVEIPLLDPRANEDVDTSGVPFRAFIANEKADGSTANNSFTLRGYVRTWLKTVCREFDRIGLNVMAGATVL